MITRIVASVVVVSMVASCGGRADRSRSTVTRVASGPITTACLQAGRGGATRERCGCVQSVADRSLSSNDQRMGASFFDDPHRAQEIRQSDNSSHEEFWRRWKAFGDEAARLCT